MSIPLVRPLTALTAILMLFAMGWPAVISAEAPKPAKPAAQAPATTGGLSWRDLTPAQRSVLAPLERDWAAIDLDRQQKWVEIAARFPRMSADEQTRVQQRMTEWSRMSPVERGRARVQYQETRQLAPQDRQERWQAYQALPIDERQRLAEQGERKTAEGAKPKGSKQRPGAAAETGPAGSVKPESAPKSTVVKPAGAPAAQPVSPSLVRGGPGATTNLVSRPAAPPLHQQPGVPKMAATPEFVDKTTLLPKRGAQAAGTSPAPSAPASKRDR